MIRRVKLVGFQDKSRKRSLYIPSFLPGVIGKGILINKTDNEGEGIATLPGEIR